TGDFEEGSKTGGQAYQTLVESLGQQGASHALFAAGIPGLRYLDGQSRSGGEGTHNYVIWDEAQISEPVRLNQSPTGERTLLQRVADAALGLFNQQPSPKGPRGQIQIFPDRRMSISLLEGADRSTFIHESGHFFLEVYRDIAADPDAPQQARDDMAALLKWFGVESADQIAVEH